MAAILEAESTLTGRNQTTVPESVRRALRLGKRDKIRCTIRPSGEVVLTRAKASGGNDPVVALFLDFLTHELATRPKRMRAVDAALPRRVRALTGRGDVDLDAPLSAEDE